jgi:hypothetical protein
MSIEEKVIEVNKTIIDITNKQKSIKEEIEILNKKKEELTRNFYKESYAPRIDKILKLQDKLQKYNNPKCEDIKNSIWELYKISFNGITTGRIETPFIVPENHRGYRFQDKIWFNPKGLALKQRPGYCYGRNVDRTYCITHFESLEYIFRNFPTLKDSLKNPNKKEIFDCFVRCFNVYKDLQALKDNEWEINVKILDENSSYSTIGIEGVELKDSDRIQTHMYGYELMLSFNHSTRAYWTGHRINISHELSDLDLFVLSQLSDEVLDKIEKVIDNLLSFHDNNLKAYETLKEEVSPYILQRII